MKKIILVLIFLVNYSITVNAQKEHQIKLKESNIIWEGSKLFGFGSHNGTVHFKEGFIKKQDDKIVGGEFIMDMNSIKSNENDGWVIDLVNHLKGKDFFDVKNNPIAKLVFTNVKHVDDLYMQITADLTINKVTNSIFFVAKLNDVKTQLDARFKIDRTLWNITYKSQGKTSIKNQVISDAIGFEVNLKL